MRMIASACCTVLLMLWTEGVHALPAPATSPSAAAPPVAAPPATAQQPAVPGAIPFQGFLHSDGFDRIRFSPTAKYVARSATIGEETVLVIHGRRDGVLTAHFDLAGKAQILDFWWVNDERLLISVGEKPGEPAGPQSTGDLYAINADGSEEILLVGQPGEPVAQGEVANSQKHEQVAAKLVTDLPHDARHVIISVRPLKDDPLLTRAEEMDVVTGHRTVVTTVPLRRADFTTDSHGIVRFAVGTGADNLSKTYYRDNARSDWQLLNDQGNTQRDLRPLGFSADGRIAYLQQDEAQGPDGIYAYDTNAHAMRLQLRDPVVDPARILFGPNREVIGAQYVDGKPKLAFFDENAPLSRLYRSLEASFPDQAVVLEDFTGDGSLALANVYSDRSPGDYYMVDLGSKKAAHLVSRYDWLDPDRMGVMRPIALTARDGTQLHGYLTLPHDSDGKNLPLVVHPHDGPFDAVDRWGFNPEIQLLASRGYAVLQVNFRGSAGYGHAFAAAGDGQRNGAMPDDVADATRWAIQQGIADPHRVCIYGVGYGGFAALVGAANAPSLYRCAIGYAGVYDMKLLYQESIAADANAPTDFFKRMRGDGDGADWTSPEALAGRISLPILLAASREDVIVPSKQTERMSDALTHAGKQVDAKIYDKQARGFFTLDTIDFYTRMLDFLDRNVGASASAGH